MGQEYVSNHSTISVMHLSNLNEHLHFEHFQHNKPNFIVTKTYLIFRCLLVAVDHSYNMKFKCLQINMSRSSLRLYLNYDYCITTCVSKKERGLFNTTLLRIDSFLPMNR